MELTEVHEDGTVSPFLNMLFDFKKSGACFEFVEQLELTKTIESLSRFGLLIKNTTVLELGFEYEEFKEHWFYKAIIPTIKEGSTIRMRKYRIELTQLGLAFVRCCIPDETIGT